MCLNSPGQTPAMAYPNNENAIASGQCSIAMTLAGPRYTAHGAWYLGNAAPNSSRLPRRSLALQ
eukprot:8239094-Lingulodinium_polyedra.AAC.1